jgi:hypothetical protein
MCKTRVGVCGSKWITYVIHLEIPSRDICRLILPFRLLKFPSLLCDIGVSGMVTLSLTRRQSDPHLDKVPLQIFPPELSPGPNDIVS